MKAVAAQPPANGQETNFYLATLAPVNHHNETPFRAWDAAMLVVLFMEVAFVMRLVLAD